MLRQITFLFILIFSFMSNETSLYASSTKDTLIYVGDPMCSWCYGFTPELEKIKQAFPNAAFEMVMGGLRAHGNESMEELSGFLWEHWKDVQKASGQKFNFAILQKSNFYYDTEPACRAVTLIRAIYPEKEHEFFKELQTAFYYYNQDPTEIETYIAVLTKMKLNTKAFEKEFEKGIAKTEVENDFEKARALKATGFPTLLAKINGKLYLVSNGYQKAERLINLLKDRGMQ